jgi:signal transduction histidine kinase
VETIQRAYLGIPAYDLADLSGATAVPSAAAGSPLRELCHDLIEPTATIRWLVRAAGTESGQDLRNRLGAIAVAAAQIAAICDDILDRPPPRAGVRLDRLARDAVASAQVRYGGVIDVVAQPVMALARPGDIIRILGNLLANACRAAGPAGRVRVHIGEADGQARLTIADSGSGFGPSAAAGRAGLGLEIMGALALKYGGSVHLDVSDLGGLAVTVRLPAPGRSSS